ncbi:MAG: glycosyltransferase [Lachnospiraceae bacterium]
MKRKLYLITKTFPHEGGETAFLSPEFPYLLKNFDVTVITTETVMESPKASSEINIDLQANLMDKLAGILHFLLHADAWRELSNIMRSGHDRMHQICRGLMFGVAAEDFYRKLRKATGLCRETDAIYYFYWADYKCFGLTMHHRKYPHIHIVARTHGYELYDEREIYGRQFFKPQMDRELDRLVFVSEYGKNYYLQQYHKQDGIKYPLHRLGIKSHGNQVPFEDRNKEFVLVSCSNAVDIKRIDLIIDALVYVEEKINWIHIGDGPCMESLQNRAHNLLDDRRNITYEWKGALPNQAVMEFYRQQPVHCFITTTSTEGGNPVSIQEALSYGIPVIGTRVSDIPYMVEGNGILLSENPKPQEIAEAITQMCQMDEKTYCEWRENASQKYIRSYDADNLHPEMMAELLGL